MSSHSGCETAACVDLANYVVVDHGDGTASIYLHVDGDSLDNDVRCGQPVRPGPTPRRTPGRPAGRPVRICIFRSTWCTPTTRASLRVRREGHRLRGRRRRRGRHFWSSAQLPVGAGRPSTSGRASACGDRRVALPVSQNVDEPADVRLVTIDRSTARVAQPKQRGVNR